MDYINLAINNGQTLVIDDTIEIKIARTNEGYMIKVLDNKVLPITLELSDNYEEFED